ncbi:MAG: trigger factor [Desulfomonile sp.]|nr:trigger factor [Desulfomonile sp.]
MTNVVVEDLSEVKKKVVFEVPRERYSEVLESEFKELKKTVQLKGFRQGKVPLNIVKTLFKDKVMADTSRKLIEETFKPALDEKNITPVSVINIEPQPMEGDAPFTYTAEIEVPPPIDLKDYTGLKVTRHVRTASDQDVQDRLKQMQERYAKLSPIPEDRGVKVGDHLLVDITAESDGRPVKELTVADYHLEVGRNLYIPNFDANLEGMTPGETKHITLDLSEDFPRKELAGKTVAFDVILKEAKERILPTLDDDFAKDMGGHETLAELEESIRADVAELKRNMTEAELEKQVVDALVEMHSFEVPQSLVEEEIDATLERSKERLLALGVPRNRLPAPTAAQRDQAKTSAERNVKAALILNAIAEKEKISVSEEDLEAEIRRRAKLFGVSEDYYRDLLAEGDSMGKLRVELRNRKVIDFIVDRGEVTEREAPPEEA